MQTLNSKQRVQGAKGMCYKYPLIRSRSWPSRLTPIYSPPQVHHFSVLQARRFALLRHRLLPQQHPRLPRQQAQRSMVCSGKGTEHTACTCFAIGPGLHHFATFVPFLLQAVLRCAERKWYPLQVCAAPSSTGAIAPFPAFLSCLRLQESRDLTKTWKKTVKVSGCAKAGLLLRVLGFKFNARLFIVAGRCHRRFRQHCKPPAVHGASLILAENLVLAAAFHALLPCF
jgi:hypothetical protein